MSDQGTFNKHGTIKQQIVRQIDLLIQSRIERYINQRDYPFKEHNVAYPVPGAIKKELIDLFIAVIISKEDIEMICHKDMTFCKFQQRCQLQCKRDLSLVDNRSVRLPISTFMEPPCKAIILNNTEIVVCEYQLT
jgi:hypothetical protein